VVGETANLNLRSKFEFAARSAPTQIYETTFLNAPVARKYLYSNGKVKGGQKSIVSKVI